MLSFTFFFFKLFLEQKLKGVVPFASPASFSVRLLSSLCIWYGIYKILFHATYTYLTSVPCHLMQYELVLVVVISVYLSYKSLMKIVLFFSFAILLAVVSCLQV